MKNVVLGVGRKILQTYYIEKSYSTAYYFDITKLLNQYRRFTLQNTSIFQKKHFSKGINYQILFNWSPRFLVELSKQNLLQLNMSNIWKLC